MTTERTRCRTRGFALAGLCLAFAACRGVPIRVTTEPPDATVTIKDAAGNRIVAVPAPAFARLRFPNEELRYTIEVEREGYLPKTEALGRSRALALPEDPEGTRRLELRLEEKRFVEQPQVVVVYEPAKGFVGRIRRVRAYDDQTESGGRIVSRIRDLAPEQGIRGLTVSPDGKRIAFAEARLSPAQEASANPRKEEFAPLESCNLRAIPIEGGGVSQLTSEEYRDVDPCFTPDGEFLLFASNRRRSTSADILRIRSTARAGGIQNIHVVSSDDAIALRPSISRDGTMAFGLLPTRPGKGAQPQIWTVGGPNQYETQITLGTQPQISPDGSRIVFVGTDGNLWTVRGDGTHETQITFKAEEILNAYLDSLPPEERRGFDAGTIDPYSHPSWSPDGRFVVYASMEGLDSTGRPNEDVWVMRADGTIAEQLTTNGSVDSMPVVTPDRKSILFLSNRGRRWAIWRIAAPPALAEG